MVADDRTGILVDYDEADPRGFEQRLAAAVNRLVADPALAERFGRAGRRRAVSEFAWDAVARETVAVYEALQH